MTRPTWDEVWLGVAESVAARSRCSRAKVGVAIVSRDNRLLSTGYNGPPRGLQVEGECINWCPRATRSDSSPDPLYDDCHAAHAESNAIARADYTEMDGSTFYITTSICKGCAKVVANTGATRIVYRSTNDGSDSHRGVSDTVRFLESCGLGVVPIQ